MDSQRTLLWIALVFVGLLMYQAWVRDYGPTAVPPTEPPTPASIQQSTGSAKPSDVPQLLTAPPGAKPPPAAAAPPQPPAATAVNSQKIHVKTDLLDVDIDTLGGDLRTVSLPTYPVAVNRPNAPLMLLSPDPSDFFVSQSGLLANGPAPDHHTLYQAAKGEYQLAPGQTALQVPLTWTGPDGVTVTKVYTFHRHSFVIDMSYQVDNHGSKPWDGRQYRQFQRVRTEKKGSRFVRTFIGAAIYSHENKYQKLSFDEMSNENLSRDIKGGWAAMVQHYFVAAWIPHQDAVNHYYTKSLDKDLYVIGMVSPAITVAPGATGTFSSQAYIGPKVPDLLQAAAPGLDLTIDYGVLTFIAKPIFWGLQYIHSIVMNWGWSIVLLTLCIKLVFYKLSEASYRSMANMRRLQPKIAAMRERYGDDRQRMSQAMMEMYKKEKVNPLGGCLPVLVQVPVFISLYWVLIESVELRQAPFIFWIHDLTLRDPFYVLPLVMGVSMFIQQKLNPPPPDPLQAKILSFLPVILTAFFALFPAGLVLYWVTNNVLSILQQWYIYRKFGRPPAAPAKAAAAGKALEKPDKLSEKAENK